MISSQRIFFTSPVSGWANRISTVFPPACVSGFVEATSLVQSYIVHHPPVCVCVSRLCIMANIHGQRTFTQKHCTLLNMGSALMLRRFHCDTILLFFFQASSGLSVWVKPVQPKGSVAIAFLYVREDGGPFLIKYNLTDLGLNSTSEYNITEVFQSKFLGNYKPHQTFSCHVNPTGVYLIKATPLGKNDITMERQQLIWEKIRRRHDKLSKKEYRFGPIKREESFRKIRK